MCKENTKYRRDGCLLVLQWAPALRRFNNDQDTNWIQDQIYSLIETSLLVPLRSNHFTLKGLCINSIVSNKLNIELLPIVDLQNDIKQYQEEDWNTREDCLSYLLGALSPVDLRCEIPCEPPLVHIHCLFFFLYVQGQSY